VENRELNNNMQNLNEAGKFNCKLVMPASATLLFTTSSKGTDGIVLDLVTDDNRTITTTLWLSPAAIDKSKDKLEKCFGFDGDFRKLANTLTFPNLDCSIETEMEEYPKQDGSTGRSCKVKWLNPARTKAKAGASDVRAVLQRLDTIRQQQVEATGPTSRAMNELDDSDMIPF